MAYRLETHEAAGEGVLRAVDEQIVAAFAQLNGHTDRARDDAVHTARKAFKKARAGLRLVRDGLEDPVYPRTNRLLRDAGRHLAGTRDAAVVVQTLDALIASAGDLLSRGAYAGTREMLVGEHRATREQILAEAEAAVAAARLTQEAREAVAAVCLADGEEVLALGLQETYRRARKRGRQAERSPTTARLHEWRKRVKDLWYQLRLLEDGWPPVMRPLTKQTHALSDLLGKDHDLASLREVAAARAELFVDPAEQATLLDLVDQQRRHLQSSAFALGHRLHAEKPSSFAKRLVAYRAAESGLTAPRPGLAG